MLLFVVCVVSVGVSVVSVVSVVGVVVCVVRGCSKQKKPQGKMKRKLLSIKE